MGFNGVHSRTADVRAWYLTQITDNNGRSLSFAYTLPVGGTAATDGLITQVTDTTGQATSFAYDAQNNLKTITWPDTKQLSFVYENPALPWAATGVVDENATRHITWGYDAAGRAISTEAGVGIDKYTVTYANPPSIQASTAVDANGINVTTHSWVAPGGVTLTLPNGQTTTLGATNVQGQNVLTGASQPAGSGCAAATSTQTVDANGRLTSVDDFTGQRSCFAYDAKGQRTVTVEGLSNTADCATVLLANASLPANARKIEAGYHPDWSVPVKVKAPGMITTTVYQGQSDPFNSNQKASCTPAANLPNGKALALVCKQVVQATLANGSIDAAVQALTSSYTYDAPGRVLSSTDPQNRVTTYAYSATAAFSGTAPNESGYTQGDLTGITAPGGYTTSFDAYDRLGRILQSTDPKGVVTQVSYTPRGWISTVSTTAPGQSARTTTYTYDAVGQLIGVLSPDGTSVSYRYDAAHRLVGASDAKGNSVTYTLDNTGNRINEEVKDPGGVLQRSIERSFDALNRVQQVTGGVQ